jgi:hypothetical protein
MCSDYFDFLPQLYSVSISMAMVDLLRALPLLLSVVLQNTISKTISKVDPWL